MPVPETLAKLAAFLEVTELLEPDERGIFLRLIKRLTSEGDLDTKLREWAAVTTDAVWFKARTYEIQARETMNRSEYQKRHLGMVEDKTVPRWQAESKLEADPEWADLNRRFHVANQLQIVADRVCDIAMQSLRSLEAQGNQQRFYGRVEIQQ